MCVLVCVCVFGSDMCEGVHGVLEAEAHAREDAESGEMTEQQYCSQQLTDKHHYRETTLETNRCVCVKLAAFTFGTDCASGCVTGRERLRCKPR